MLIGGDAGIGKTRLVTEVADRARLTGALVLEGGCVSLGDGGGLPFAPIVEALRRLPASLADDPTGAFGSIEDLRTPATAELGRLIPELGTSPDAEQGAFDRPESIQARIFEGVLSLLRSLGERAPVVLILEDLHWADGSTRDVTSFLARNARTERLLVIGTYRTDELNRRHPLRPWLAEIERLPHVRRVELARFGRAELEAQIEAILEHAAPSGLIATVELRTEGNPFFVEELLASGASEAGHGLPPTLRDVLLSRVTALSDPAQRLLGVAAVAGRTVDSDLLATVAGSPEAELEDAVRDALAAQILVHDQVVAGGAYRFRHALLAEAVYDDLLPSERRRLHAAYAEALEARPTPDGADGAATWPHSPITPPPPTSRSARCDAWVAAARAAPTAFGSSESMRAYERAIDLWDAVPADDRPQGVDPAALYDEAALAAMISGRTDRAVDFARMATELMDRGREPDRWAEANVRLARALWVSGTMTEGLAILESTAAALEGSEPSPTHARAVAALAGAYMLRGDHSRAITCRHARDRPCPSRGVADRRGARPQHARREHRALSATRQMGCVSYARRSMTHEVDRGRVRRLGPQLCQSDIRAPDLRFNEESLDRAIEGIVWSKSVGAWGGYGRFIAGNAMDAAIELGRWDQAEGFADDLLAHDAVGANRMGTIAVVGLFLVHRGQLDIADELLQEGRSLVEPLQEAQFTGPVFVGLVELALTRGEYERAASVAAAGVERLARTDDRYYVAELLSIAASAEADGAETGRASARRRRPEAAAIEAANAYETRRGVGRVGRR